MKSKHLPWIATATVLTCLLFYYLIGLCYPKIIEWIAAGVKSDLITTDQVVPQAQLAISSFLFACSALLAGLFTHKAGKIRSLKKTVIIFFTLIDVAVVAAFLAIVFLKYRFLKQVADLLVFASEHGEEQSILFADVNFLMIGIFACIAVSFIGWLFTVIRPIPE